MRFMTNGSPNPPMKRNGVRRRHISNWTRTSFQMIAILNGVTIPNCTRTVVATHAVPHALVMGGSEAYQSPGERRRDGQEGGRQVFFSLLLSLCAYIGVYDEQFSKALLLLSPSLHKPGEDIVHEAVSISISFCATLLGLARAAAADWRSHPLPLTAISCLPRRSLSRG